MHVGANELALTTVNEGVVFRWMLFYVFILYSCFECMLLFV